MNTSEGLHILIAEDDSSDAYLIIESFKRQKGFSKINMVSDGEELLDFLKNNTTQLPDVILTDINMPKKNGIEALEEIVEDNELSKIPVFIFSSTLNPLYERKGKQLGAMGYLIKPLNLAGFDEIPVKILEALNQN